MHPPRGPTTRDAVLPTSTAVSGERRKASARGTAWLPSRAHEADRAARRSASCAASATRSIISPRSRYRSLIMRPPLRLLSRPMRSLEPSRCCENRARVRDRIMSKPITPCPRMGKIAGLSLALLLATGTSAVVPAALPVNPQDSVRSLYDTLLSTMKDGRRPGQSGRYARLSPAEYIVSADSSCLMHQRGCAERIGVSIKFIHIAQILNGAAE
jgi:hypothetical protein